MLTDRQIEILRAVETYGSQRKAADALGISRRTLRTVLGSIHAKQMKSPAGFAPVKVTTDGNGTPISVVHKPADDTSDEERTGKIVRRSTLYGPDGSVTGEWVIRKPEETDISTNSVVEILKSLNVEIPREPESKHYTPAKDDRLALINIIDDHMNMKAHRSETGIDWNIEKAYNTYVNKFQNLIDNMPMADSALIVNIGDQFHNNDHMKVTPASKNMLDTDVPYPDMASIVVRLNRERIRIAKNKFGKVTYVVVRGNHDEDAAVLLYEVLKVAFENDENVTILFATGGLFVHQHGENLIAFDHGDKGKPDQLAGFVASEYSSVYGATSFRYIHTGHIHHERAKDTWGGFLWRSHRTLSPRDEYAYRNRYHSPRSIHGYIYDRNHGEIFTTTCNC